MSPLSTLTHTIAKGSTFLISSPFDVTKIQKENCLDVSSTGSFPFPMSMNTHIHIHHHPYGDILDLNGIERVIIHLSVPENYGFNTIICGYFYRSPPLQVLEVHINGIRDISIHITESKIHISYLKTMIRH
jgi:hypothetical protein